MIAHIEANSLINRRGQCFIPSGEYIVSVDSGGGMRSGLVTLFDKKNHNKFSVDEYEYREAKRGGLITEIN